MEFYKGITLFRCIQYIQWNVPDSTFQAFHFMDFFYSMEFQLLAATNIIPCFRLSFVFSKDSSKNSTFLLKKVEFSDESIENTKLYLKHGIMLVAAKSWNSME